MIPNPRHAFWSYLFKEILEVLVFLFFILIAASMVGTIFGFCDSEEPAQGGNDAARVSDG